VKTITSIILTTILLIPGISNASESPSCTNDTLSQKSQVEPPNSELKNLEDGAIEAQAKIKPTAKNITVRVTSASNGGSGVLIAQKGATYLVLTNAHVVRRDTQLQIQTVDGQKYTAKPINGGFDAKYDLALLEFTSNQKYQIADLSNLKASGGFVPVDTGHTIYSAGFPFDSKDIRISSGTITQLSDIPFDNGTQIGYVTAKGEKGIRQGMSGGPILTTDGKFLGINTIGSSPILPNYIYNNGSRPIPRLAAKYRNANWGIPVYNFLTNVKSDILYGYDNLPKLEHQVTPTGYLAQLDNKARQMTVRIETGENNGSGVIIAKEGNSYYVLTAKHVVSDLETKKLFANPKIITYDQDIYQPTSTIVATNEDLAVVKFSSNTNYPLAKLSEASQNNDDLVFVGGFPGRNKINSPLWQWQLNPGFVLDQESGKLVTQSNLSFSNGYDLYYGSISYGGMSGGPVFNTDGNVIGIHGRAESTNNESLGGSLGISIQSFTGLLAELKIKPELLTITKKNPAALNEGDRKVVFAAMQNILKPGADADGKRWLAYGNQLTRTLQFEQAVVAFDRAIAKGDVLQGNYGKALSLLILRKYDLAQKAIDKAIALVPNDKNRVNFYYFWKYQSRILARLKKYDESLKSIDVAIGLLKSQDSTKPEDPILLMEKASIFFENKQSAAAIAVIEKIIKSQPTAFAYHDRGVIKSQSGDIKGAIADLSQAIKINPKFAYGYATRGRLKVMSNDFKGAIVDAKQAVNINPKFALAYLVMGGADIGLLNFKEAINDCSQAIKLTKVEGLANAFGPSNSILAGAYFVRGIANAQLENLDGTVNDITEASKLFRQLGQMELYQQSIEILEKLKMFRNTK
jgi:S1-C subfamily serine protease